MNEKLTELFQTMADNPGMEVLFFMDNEEICDDAAWTLQEIKRIEVDYVHSFNGCHIVGALNIEEQFEVYYGDSTGQARERCQELFESGEITEKICVFMGA